MRRFILILLVLLAGCNLNTSDTLPPTLDSLPTTSYVAPTPYRAPTLPVAPTLMGGQGGVGAQSVGATPTNRNILTPVPAQTLIQNPQPPATAQNAIEAFVNNLIIPAWNFVYTFVLEGISTLWLFAGARGGVFAQVFCCIAPAVLVVGVVLFRLRILRRR